MTCSKTCHSLLELFYTFSQGSYNKLINHKNILHTKIYEKKVMSEFAICFEKWAEIALKKSLLACWLSTLKNRVGNRMSIWVKESGRTGFSLGWQGCSLGFPSEQPCQPSENPVLPSSFTQINPIYLVIFTHIAQLSEQYGESTLPKLISQEGQCWNCNWECLYCDWSRKYN